jgi:hypothetical protein
MNVLCICKSQPIFEVADQSTDLVVHLSLQICQGSNDAYKVFAVVSLMPPRKQQHYDSLTLTGVDELSASGISL